MCQDCGCSDGGAIAVNGIPAEAAPGHISGPTQTPIAPPSQPANAQVISIHQGILAKNHRMAEQNRQVFRDRAVLTLNLLSSPGAGKTAMIERLAQDLPQRPHPQTGEACKLAVIVGDLATDNDAQRLRQAGAPAVQITTGNACHLEADMVAQAMQQLDWSGLNLLVIENVGNLVCPASYDLGEALRVVLFSVTEGEDKPLKYPTMFKTADIVLISKVELAAVVGCDLELAIANLRRVAPQAQIIPVSARTGAGLDKWYAVLLAALPGIAPPDRTVRPTADLGQH